VAGERSDTWKRKADPAFDAGKEAKERLVGSSSSEIRCCVCTAPVPLNGPAASNLAGFQASFQSCCNRQLRPGVFCPCQGMPEVDSWEWAFLLGKCVQDARWTLHCGYRFSGTKVMSLFSLASHGAAGERDGCDWAARVLKMTGLCQLCYAGACLLPGLPPALPLLPLLPLLASAVVPQETGFNCGPYIVPTRWVGGWSCWLPFQSRILARNSINLAAPFSSFQCRVCSQKKEGKIQSIGGSLLFIQISRRKLWAHTRVPIRHRFCDGIHSPGPACVATITAQLQTSARH
jgi:hypothetical protein